MYRVRWAGASRSIRSTRWPSSARAAPRFTAVVVLPTPPFCMATAIVRAKIGPSLTEAGISGGSTRMAPPLIIDVVVVLILIVALIVGYQRGVIQPLMAEI